MASAVAAQPAQPENKPNALLRKMSLTSVKEHFIGALLLACALVSIATTLGIILILVTETIQFFRIASIWEFISGTEWTPNFETKHFGIWPLLSGTLVVAGIASCIGIPLGLASALYLSEYSSPRMRNFIKPTLEILAGVPTVVYGYFALIFITPYVLRPVFQSWLGFEVDVLNTASAGVAVGVMIVPTISSLSEDVLRAVPRGLREAAYALGSTKFDVSVRVVLPAALSGIFASFLLAISRAVGETMVVTIAAGTNPRLTANPFRTAETMTAYIVNVCSGDAVAGSVEYLSLYAVAMALFVITLAMNILSQFVLQRFREVYN